MQTGYGEIFNFSLYEEGSTPRRFYQLIALTKTYKLRDTSHDFKCKRVFYSLYKQINTQFCFANLWQSFRRKKKKKPLSDIWP